MARHCPPGCPHLHFSTLKWFGRSPAHYNYYRTHPSAPTSAMHLGSAIHNLILENGSAIVKFGGASRRGKAWDEFMSSAIANYADSIILTESEYETAEAATEAVLAHAGAGSLLHGLKEQTFDWTQNGKVCRGTCDAVNGNMVELKSTNDARPDFFSRTAMRLSYYAQLPWYMDGYNANRLLSRESAHSITLAPLVERAFIVAVETSPPYVVQTFELTANAIDFGRRQYRLWMERLHVCEESGIWPGYVESDVPLDVAEELALTIGGELVEVE